jgi:NADH dehydrogenase
LLILGGGFAGVWAALAAARQRKRHGAQVTISVVSPTSVFGIRPRFYEDDLEHARIELSRVLEPVGVEHIVGKAVALDAQACEVALETGSLRYDALVLATGSALVRPAIPGGGLAHSVDDFAAAQALCMHLEALSRAAPRAGASTVVVVGGGFTGIELAAELSERLSRLFGHGVARVVLVERSEHVAPEFGQRARAVIREALESLGVRCITATSVSEIGHDFVKLATGERIEAMTAVWTGGVRPNQLGGSVAGATDSLGRVRVDANLQVLETPNIWAAGDVAHALVDGEHPAMMSCQHALPQGRFAGHNAMSWLLDGKQQAYSQHLYLTCLDLGRWGALLTRGFDREEILCSGSDAKRLKRFINRHVIYPPLDGDETALLRAAKPHADSPLQSALTIWLLRQRWARQAFTKRADTPRSDQLA